jgi:hypothetical protein
MQTEELKPFSDGRMSSDSADDNADVCYLFADHRGFRMPVWQQKLNWLKSGL